MRVPSQALPGLPAHCFHSSKPINLCSTRNWSPIDSSGVTLVLLQVDSPHVLAIGAHPDDIEIGTGGLIHRLIQEHNAAVQFLILTEGIQHPKEGVYYEPSVRRKESIT